MNLGALQTEGLINSPYLNSNFVIRDGYEFKQNIGDENRSSYGAKNAITNWTLF